MRVLSKKLFPKIKFILGNNAVEPIGVKSHYFGEDLQLFQPNSLSINKKYSIFVKHQERNYTYQPTLS